MRDIKLKFKLFIVLVILYVANFCSVTFACDSSEVGCNQVLQQQQRDAWIYYQGGGDIGNGTLGSDNSAYIPPKVITLPDSWGALAESAKTGAMGVASKKASKQESKKAALQNCALKGASDCKVLMTYKNTCVGIAASSSGGKYAHNPNISVLRQQLLSDCSKDSNGEQCKIVYEECMP